MVFIRFPHGKKIYSKGINQERKTAKEAKILVSKRVPENNCMGKKRKSYLA